MNKFIDLLRLKIKGYIIIDNFFPDNICQELRYFSLSDKRIDHQWDGYVAKNFDIGNGRTTSLKMVSDRYICPKISFLRKESYKRSWNLIMESVGKGVLPHIDPGSRYSFNIWLTPDYCVEDKNKNGLRIYRKRYDKINYGGLVDKEFLKGVKYDIIPYRYNRAMVFGGNTIHETDYVSMKSGFDCQRISYTFLYDG